MQARRQRHLDSVGMVTDEYSAVELDCKGVSDVTDSAASSVDKSVQ